jgi:hypothetical protein
VSTTDAILVTGEIERRTGLTHAEFVQDYERRRPVVLRAPGRARAEDWTPARLCERVGEAELELYAGVFDEHARARGFPAARLVSMRLAHYVEALRAGATEAYLFNVESSVFRCGARDSELAVGRGRSANPGLAPLAEALPFPAWLRPGSLIYGMLILGGPAQHSPLHYDLGGEAKVLVQLHGRKRVLLFAPSEAHRLYFPSWFEESPPPYRVPHASEASLDLPDPARFPLLAGARAEVALLEPGDVLYWPSYWSHHVRNLDAFTAAASFALEEQGASGLELRETLGHMGRLFRKMAGDPRHGFDLGSEAGVAEALRKLEQELLREGATRTTQWAWHNAILGA